jgi:hypothetical protein
MVKGKREGEFSHIEVTRVAKIISELCACQSIQPLSPQTISLSYFKILLDEGKPVGKELFADGRTCTPASDVISN